MNTVRTYIKSFMIALAIAGASVAVYAEPYDAQTQTIVVNQPQVRVLNGQVEITVPGDEDRNVTIYALTGQVVKTITAAPGTTTVDLPKGYYIVKCDRMSCRVVVK